MNLWKYLCMCLLVAGCDGTMPKLPERVEVPVPVPCIGKGDIPPRPAFWKDEDLMVLDRFKRTIAVWDERREREVYERDLEAIVRACAR